MKKAAIYTAILVLASGLMSCGGKSSTTAIENPTSKVLKRVFVTNEFFSRVQIIDAAVDLGNSFNIVVGTNPSIMVKGTGGLLLVYNQSGNILSLVNTATEVETGQVALAGPTESIVLMPDSLFAYAAIPSLGVVQKIDISAKTATNLAGNIPGVRRLVRSNNGAKILAFANDSDSVAVITVSTGATTLVAGFDRAYSAVFSSDDSKAYILNCGAQCGGTSAKVTSLDMATNTAGASATVNAATVGLLDGTNLYVAGQPVGLQCLGKSCGTLDVVNVSTMTRSSNTNIGDGLHSLMVKGPNSKLYVGALTCSNTATGSTPLQGGCLSIYNMTANTASSTPPNGGITSIQPITGRSVVYVIEGGNLRIYDSATDLPTVRQIDISGRVVELEEID